MVALYEKLVATRPEVTRKGASMPYTSLNGNMSSFLTPTGQLALRLPAEERDAFMETHATTLCEQHGRVMKEYVSVPPTLLARTKELSKYFALSHEYVGLLKPKPTKKKAKKK